VNLSTVLNRQHWLIGIFDLEKSELVIPGKGRIKVDDQVVRKIFNLPVGGEHIIYENNSGSDTFTQFYKVFGHKKDQVAPNFTQVENWLLDEGKGNLSDKWLQYWLIFAISTLLCPTSSTKLCVKAFHSVANPRDVGNYNWCQLVVERLKKGIIEHKENNRKFVLGCFLFLTVRATNMFLFCLLPPPPHYFFTNLFFYLFLFFILQILYT
jgi:hypothetical protein